MRIGLIPETPWERVLLWLGRVPTPLAETHLAFLHARAVMTAAEVGLFDALAEGPRQPGDVAAACGCDPGATLRLLDALAAARYLRAGRDGYALTPLARRWLLSDGPRSVTAKLDFQRHEWDFAARLPAFVRRGEAVDIHKEMPPEAWRRYRLAMRDLARLAAPVVASRAPLPRHARHLLDVGGAHGLFAAACCDRHPGLSAEVLDLPAALPDDPAPLAGVPGGERVTFRAADARHVDLGEGVADAVLIANLAHHLSAEENRALLARASRALRAGGCAVVIEWTGDDASASGRLLDLYFALTSHSGTWTAGEVAAWQREAGLEPMRPRRLRSLPGTAILAARKP